MATTSFAALRRFAAFAYMLILSSLCLCVTAAGQVATASFNTGLTHPTGWGTLAQTAINSNGDWVVVDYANGGVYEFPAGGGAAITLLAPASLSGGGTYSNPAIAIDPNNNLYLGANWNNCLLMFPYDTTTKTWDGLSTINAANSTATNSLSSETDCTNSGKNNSVYAFAQYGLSGYGPGYFQPWGITIGNGANLVIGAQNSGNFIINLPVTGAWASPVAASTVTNPISAMTKRPNSVAQDPEGNIYFVEDSGGLSGVYEIPAGTTGLGSDAGLTRVDPNLPSVSAVIADSTGNLYISDSTAGVFMVPNPSGTPQTSAAVMLTPVPAQGEVAIDWMRNIVYVPTAQTQSNGQADVAEVTFGFAEFGSSPVGTSTTQAASVSFGFNSKATPASFVIEEAGVQNPDFAITGGNCTTGTAYAADTGCTESLTLTPHSAGSISAKLSMLDAKGNILSSIVLHGTGVGSNVQATPSLESAIGGSLKTPSQVSVDEMGNVYVADAGLKQVLMYAAGSGASVTPVSIGTGVTSPTGVAVNGAGDVFIADSSSGSVYEVPYGPAGLNAAGQVTLVSGLGAQLNLAADALDNLYIADPVNKRVVKLSNVNASTPIMGQTETSLTAGFTAPSYVAVDAGNNLYVVDGSNLFELAAMTGGVLGAPTTLLTDLSGVTGVAVDASGAVYVSSTSGTLRVPYVAGALAPADRTVIAQSVTNPTAVALDRVSNLYLADATAENIHFVASGSGLLNFGNVPPAVSLDATLTNSGNAPLTVTGYSSTNSVDYTAADGTCVGNSPVAAGGVCMVDITLNPGPGEQGTLTSTIGIASNAVNPPIIVDATGVGSSLANSVTTIAVGSSAQVISTPLTINVAPKSGAGIPSGQVIVSYPSWTVINGVISPTTVTQTATLSNGTIALTLTQPVLAGSQTFTVAYSGDRAFGKSTGTITAMVAKSAVASIAVPSNVTIPPFLPYVLEQNGSTPYDGSAQYWQYNYTVQVNTVAGSPTGTVTFMDSYQAGASTTLTSGVACPAQSAAGVQPLNTSGQATLATSCLPMPQNVTYTPIVSTHVISPVYSGDANFEAFTGPSTTFQAVRSPAVLITSSPASLTVQSGSTASAILTAAPILGYGFAGKNQQLNDYNFPVTLTCDNLPPHATCTFTYSNPDPNIPNAVDIPCPNGITAAEANSECSPGLVTVTINTNVAVGTQTSQIAPAAPITLAAMFGFGLIGLFFRRKLGDKGRLLLIFCMVILSGALAGSLTACNTTNLTPPAVLSTPSGTYAVTITAQQVGSQVIQLANGPITIVGSQNQVSLPFTVNVTVQ
jgi:sugar lactone lactonase YvrE